MPAFTQESTPLGELYDGRCAADLADTIPPETLRRCCNRGYARKACGRAATAEADAHRFLVKADDGATVTVAWSAERDHLPLATGNALVTTLAAGNSDPLALQARACAAAYRHVAGKDGIVI